MSTYFLFVLIPLLLSNWQVLEIGDSESLQENVMEYFKQKIVPHIVSEVDEQLPPNTPDEQLGPSTSNELVSVTDDVIDALETGKLPKVM